MGLEALNAVPLHIVLALIGFGAVLCYLALLKTGRLLSAKTPAAAVVKRAVVADVPAGHELGEAKRTIDARIDKRLADLSFETKTLQQAKGAGKPG